MMLLLKKTSLISMLLGHFLMSTLQMSNRFETHHEDGKMTSDILWQASESSLVLCSILCGKDQLCKSLSYEGLTNLCTGHSKCPNDIGVIISSCTGCVLMSDERANCTAVETTTSPPPDDCSNGIGGDGGDPFSDVSSWAGKNITSIRLSCAPNYIVNQIQIRYGSTWADMHPAINSPFVAYNFSNDEYVTNVNVRAGHLIYYVEFTTNKRTIPECGSSTDGNPFTQSGRRLLYISGRAGGMIDCLIFHWA